MGVFYDAVVKMREKGRSVVKEQVAPVKKPKKIVVTETVEKETAVKKNDKSAGRKS